MLNKLIALSVFLCCAVVFASPASDFYVGGKVIFNNPRWEDLRFPANSLQGPPGLAPFAIPDWIQFPVGGATNTYLPCMDTGSDEGLVFVVQMPHSRKDNSDVDFHVHWAPSTTNTGTVVWQLTCTGFADVGETVGSTISIQFSDTADGTANQHLYVDGTPTSGASTTISAISVCSIFRDVSEDNYADDACLIEIDMHYLVDTPGGSAGELTK